MVAAQHDCFFICLAANGGRGGSESLKSPTMIGAGSNVDPAYHLDNVQLVMSLKL